MANVTIGYGATVSIKIGAATAVVLAEVTSIGIPNPQVAEVDATHFTSPGRAREYISGLIDNGEISFGMNYEAGSATDDLVNEALAETAPVQFVVTIPTAAAISQTFTFPGIVKGYEKEIPIDDRQTATMTVRVAGAVVQAPAA